AVTLNVDSLGAKNVKTNAGAALTGGELTASQPLLLYYTGTEFRLLFSQAATVLGALPLGYISGFTTANNAGTPNDYIDIAAGQARDSTNAANLVGTAMTKQLNNVWAAGTNNGAVLQSAN